MIGDITEIMKNAGITHFGVCTLDGLRIVNNSASKRMPEGSASAIVCLLPYYVGEYPRRNISSYAIVRDYHLVGSEILGQAVMELARKYPGERFVHFIDHSPFSEVLLAREAGLGVIGRSGLLINKDFGSRVFIGEIVTTLSLPPSARLGHEHCGQCGRCVQSCPAGALASGSGVFDKSLCRSYITQKKGGLSGFEYAQVKAGGMVWGCDICGDVCPRNKDKQKSNIEAFYKNIVPVLSLENIDLIGDDRAFFYKGRDILKRNLAIVRGSATYPAEVHTEME